MNEQEVLQLLGKLGAIITDSHIVYTSGKHGSAYINKDALFPRVRDTSDLCRVIAQHFVSQLGYDKIDTVIGPTVGGALLAQRVAFFVSCISGREVMAVYADKNRDVVISVRPSFVPWIREKRVLVVDDVLTTGGSAALVVEGVRAFGGKVIGLGAICNRGGVTAKDVADVPHLFALVNIQLEAWDEADCPLCKQNVPINTDVGKGREFLSRKQA